MNRNKHHAQEEDLLEEPQDLSPQPGTLSQQHRENVSPSHSSTVSEAAKQEHHEDQVVKTSFYPKPAQLDKLDDLAAEYNRRYRRKRPRINRNDIVRFLIDLVDINMLDTLQPKR